MGGSGTSGTGDEGAVGPDSPVGPVDGGSATAPRPAAGAVGRRQRLVVGVGAVVLVVLVLVAVGAVLALRAGGDGEPAGFGVGGVVLPEDSAPPGTAHRSPATTGGRTAPSSDRPTTSTTTVAAPDGPAFALDDPCAVLAGVDLDAFRLTPASPGPVERPATVEGEVVEDASRCVYTTARGPADVVAEIVLLTRAPGAPVGPAGARRVEEVVGADGLPEPVPDGVEAYYPTFLDGRQQRQEPGQDQGPALRCDDGVPFTFRVGRSEARVVVTCPPSRAPDGGDVDAFAAAVAARVAAIPRT